MRRALPVIAATAGGLALIANFHSKPAGVPVAAGAGAGGSGDQAAPTTTEPTTTAPTTRTSQPSRATSTTAAPSATRSVDGPVITTDYGNVEVRIILQGTRLTDVQAIELPQDRARSARISQYAGPQLRSEALQAQSANIDLVSGATYTSEGYIESLQGALDKAGR